MWPDRAHPEWQAQDVAKLQGTKGNTLTNMLVLAIRWLKTAEDLDKRCCGTGNLGFSHLPDAKM